MEIGDGARLRPWFHALAQRLARVVVLNRDWTSAVTDTLLMHTPTSPKPPVAVFLDPPYVTGVRSDTLYHSDMEGSSDDVAVAAYQWAVEHGNVYRIAYCCHDGDFDVPDGWTTVGKSFARSTRGTSDLVMFSPACIDPEEGRRQGRLI